MQSMASRSCTEKALGIVQPKFYRLNVSCAALCHLQPTRYEE